MRRIAIINQKGGVGKTTTTTNLGAALAIQGRRVLVVDMDAQANLSLGLGVEAASGEPTSYTVLLGETKFAEAVRATNLPGLFLVASHLDLSGAELELAAQIGREFMLRDALLEWVDAETKLQGRAPVDYVLFDCPPSLGLLSINALAAANEVLITLQTEFLALQGMSKLVEIVQLLKKRLNPELTITGILPCLYDSRLRLAREVLGEIRRYFAGQVFEKPVRTSVKLAEAPSFAQTIFEYAPDGKAAADYMEVARAVIALEARDASLSALPAFDASAGLRRRPANVTGVQKVRPTQPVTVAPSATNADALSRANTPTKPTAAPAQTTTTQALPATSAKAKQGTSAQPPPALATSKAAPATAPRVVAKMTPARALPTAPLPASTAALAEPLAAVASSKAAPTNPTHPSTKPSATRAGTPVAAAKPTTAAAKPIAASPRPTTASPTTAQRKPLSIAPKPNPAPATRAAELTVPRAARAKSSVTVTTSTKHVPTKASLSDKPKSAQGERVQRGAGTTLVPLAREARIVDVTHDETPTARAGVPEVLAPPARPTAMATTAKRPSEAEVDSPQRAPTARASSQSSTPKNSRRSAAPPVADARILPASPKRPAAPTTVAKRTAPSAQPVRSSTPTPKVHTTPRGGKKSAPATAARVHAVPTRSTPPAAEKRVFEPVDVNELPPDAFEILSSL